jgi:hypothetical protein
VTATSTPTPTATPSASPTPTPTPSPGVAGGWIEDDFRITLSNCARQITDQIESEVAPLFPCENRLTLEGSRITAVDCMGATAEGEIDSSNVARFSNTQSESQSGCTVTLGLESTIDLSRSPTTARYELDVDLRGQCAFSDCRMVIETTWTRG